MSLTGMGTDKNLERREGKEGKNYKKREFKEECEKEEGDSGAERGGPHSVCGERSFLNASFIQEHFVCTRALVLCPHCGGLSRGTVQTGDTVVIHISHVY